MRTRTVQLFAPVVAMILFTFAVVLATPCFAQVATGTPPFGSYGGGPDVINLGNLNVHLVIPVVQKPGRGLPFSYNLSYDSSIWQPVGSSGNQTWQRVTNTNWGWTTSMPSGGHISYFTTTVTKFCRSTQQYYTIFYYGGWTYTDGFGTAHGFSGTTNVVNGCGNSQSSLAATAWDGSGYTISVTGSTVNSLYASDGTRINPYTGATTVEDRNGNEITSTTSSGTTNYYDTLSSTTPVLTISGSGTPTSPFVDTYTAPSGASASYKVIYAAYTVKTNFGCGGINEFGATSENLVSEIDLPDFNSVPSDKYTFTYESTPGFSGDVTGRLASVTLPTGGTLSYTYTGGNNNTGVECSDGSTATLQRTTPDGSWSYTRTDVSGTQWQTTVQDPQNNQTVIQFQQSSNNFYETLRQIYQGSAVSGDLLQQVSTCYNGASTSCNVVSVSLPITQKMVTISPSGSTTLDCEHNDFYNSFGLPTEVDDYDYGNGTIGPLIRKTLIAYASLGNNIVNAPSQITIENGSGTVVAQTSITYDQGTPAALSGTPQHIAISGSRGNPTSISYLVAGSTILTKSLTYFDTGNVQTATDVNNAPTTFNYPDATSTCGNAFPTSVSEPLSLSRSMTWNCTGGVETSVTDENGKTVSATYSDANFWRPASTTDQLSNQTNITYAMNPASVESSLNFNGSNSTADLLTTLDALGRTQVTQQKQAPGATTYDSVETDYDSLGRPSRATVPYSGTSGQTNSSAPATTTSYDALNRPLLNTDGGGGTATLSYSANDVLQTIGPAPTGENTKQRQSEYNGIGQLTSVCEITGLSGSGTCGQNTSATGYWTKYTYDGLGNLLTVTQNAQASSTQSRTYMYDGLGRMTSEANPETGTITYVYDSDSTCGTSEGDLVKKTDAAGNVSCYAYDALHRNTSITYPSGPNSANTPSKHFIYDSATVNSVAMANAKSRLAEAYTCVSTCTSKLTDEGFSYTARGEVSDVYESTPDSGGYFHVDETYWANGALDQISGLAGLPTLTYSPDGEGRANSVSASSGQNPISSTTYNVASEATQVNLGSGDNDAFSFDPNTFRMTQYKFNVNGQSVVSNLTWNANGTLQKLNITDPFNGANTQNCAYGYDDLARIASGNCGSVWSQTFSYDAFGNITKSGSMQFQPGYNLNNQMATGTSYDAMGDVVNDGLHSYAWNSDTRPTTIDTVTVTYDALGRMVEQSKSGTNTEIVYDALGNKLALMNGTSTMVKAFAPLPAGATAVYNGSGLQYYRHPDWLGSSRFASTPSRAMYNDLAFAPFGEPYAQAGSTGATDISFAGNNEDTTTNLYDAYFREYGIQGRWPSPDPAGVAVANPANPQSWNRYAYVLNNPSIFADPTGLGNCGKQVRPDPASQQAFCGGVNIGGDSGCVSVTVDSFGGCLATYGDLLTLLQTTVTQVLTGWVVIGVWDNQTIGFGGCPVGASNCYITEIATYDTVYSYPFLDFFGLSGPQPSGPGAPQSPTIGPYKPPPSPTPQGVTPGCMAGALIQNFVGDEGHAGATVAVNVGAAIALGLAKQAAPGILPGPGWVYVTVAAIWDVGMVAKSYVDCRNGGPTPP